VSLFDYGVSHFVPNYFLMILSSMSMKLKILINFISEFKAVQWGAPQEVRIIRTALSSSGTTFQRTWWPTCRKCVTKMTFMTSHWPVTNRVSFKVTRLSSQPHHPTSRPFCEGVRSISIQFWYLICLLILESKSK